MNSHPGGTIDESDLNNVSGQVVDAALRVHSALGPGLLESTCEACLCVELLERGLCVQTQVSRPVHYRGLQIDAGYRIDLLVEDLVIVEIKSVSTLAPIHTAQLLTYLKLGGKPIGLLLSFNVVRMRDGIKRVVNKPYVR